jgi:hypothetical protein
MKGVLSSNRAGSERQLGTIITMRRTTLLIAFWTACTLLPAELGRAQGDAAEIFQKAPPEIDAALRARVSKFFQAHVDKKFRLAEQVVAEDSKDYYFTMEKTGYLGFEIVKIDYSENFTKAKVIVGAEMEWRTPRTGKMIVKPPLASLWKLENGDWYWYIIPQKDWETPFGKMKPGADSGAAVVAPSILDAFKGVDINQVLRQVQLSTNQVELKSYEPSEGEVTIENHMPGPITLRLDETGVRGLTTVLDKVAVGSNQSAHLSIKYVPDTTAAKPTTILNLEVVQTGQRIPIRLTFAIPPDVEKLIPKK